MTTPASAHAAHSPTSRLGPFRFDRRSLRADDVSIDILCCGVCHSDLHDVRTIVDMASLKQEVTA